MPSKKYAKAIITANEASANASKIVGHRIKIVPLSDASDITAGESLPVKILFEEKPLSTYVYATYAGYYSEDEPFPVIANGGTAVAGLILPCATCWVHNTIDTQTLVWHT